ncbi:MAG: DUF4862 family protein [Proteobacteria bacterium]|nr:DUF4862 family protein [Pseudomonadota bacterium]
MGYFLGAYAASPCGSQWSEAAEGAYFDGLRRLPTLRGLEVPFTGRLHRHDEAWFLTHIDRACDFVVTCIPGTMEALQSNPHFGLASESGAGRQAALAFAASARDAVTRLNGHLGRTAVVAVELHSAPSPAASGVRSSAASFTRSLSEIRSWDWQGAGLVVEHCDAFRPGRPYIKGFLGLEEEIDAVTRANAGSALRIGIAVNWGRSVLEMREPATALQHIRRLRSADLLSGLIFSGCGAVAGPYGAWQDTHMPHAPAPGIEYGAEGSLMTEAEIDRSLAAAVPSALAFLGAKIAVRPEGVAVAERVGFCRDALALIDRHLAVAA